MYLSGAKLAGLGIVDPANPGASMYRMGDLRDVQPMGAPLIADLYGTNYLYHVYGARNPRTGAIEPVYSAIRTQAYVDAGGTADGTFYFFRNDPSDPTIPFNLYSPWTTERMNDLDVPSRDNGTGFASWGDKLVIGGLVVMTGFAAASVLAAGGTVAASATETAIAQSVATAETVTGATVATEATTVATTATLDAATEEALATAWESAQAQTAIENVALAEASGQVAAGTLAATIGTEAASVALADAAAVLSGAALSGAALEKIARQAINGKKTLDAIAANEAHDSTPTPTTPSVVTPSILFQPQQALFGLSPLTAAALGLGLVVVLTN